LGIRTNLLYRWKQQIEGQQQGKSLAEDEREELKRLRKENKLLRMEKDILKKASAHLQLMIFPVADLQFAISIDTED
jgi:transposase